MYSAFWMTSEACLQKIMCVCSFLTFVLDSVLSIDWWTYVILYSVWDVSSADCLIKMQQSNIVFIHWCVIISLCC